MIARSIKGHSYENRQNRVAHYLFARNTRGYNVDGAGLRLFPLSCLKLHDQPIPVDFAWCDHGGGWIIWRLDFAEDVRRSAWSEEPHQGDFLKIA
jgi:hypothetical protein